MHSSHIVHNVGKAAEQRNDHAFGKLYISLTEADILPVGGEKSEYQLQLRKIQFMQTYQISMLDEKNLALDEGLRKNCGDATNEMLSMI